VEVEDVIREKVLIVEDDEIIFQLMKPFSYKQLVEIVRELIPSDIQSKPNIKPSLDGDKQVERKF
jgi:hypothetical protein